MQGVMQGVSLLCLLSGPAARMLQLWPCEICATGVRIACDFHWFPVQHLWNMLLDLVVDIANVWRKTPKTPIICTSASRTKAGWPRLAKALGLRSCHIISIHYAAFESRIICMRVGVLPNCYTVLWSIDFGRNERVQQQKSWAVDVNHKVSE
jgi:hypothetical protein